MEFHSTEPSRTSNKAIAHSQPIFVVCIWILKVQTMDESVGLKALLVHGRPYSDSWSRQWVEVG